MVSVVVRLDDVRDPKPILLSDLEIVSYLPLRVDYRRLAAVGNDVGAATQIFVEHFSEQHVKNLLFDYLPSSSTLALSYRAKDQQARFGP
jgi:hypothetical protein